jgi:hypothetical protein
MTHYACDRCGARASGQKSVYAEVTVDNWHGDGSLPVRQMELVVNVQIVEKYNCAGRAAPDLCDSCHAEILHDAASKLDPDTVDAIARTR